MILEIFLGRQLQYLVDYVRRARFSGSDMCATATICLVIRQSGEGCPCQEGGQDTNSFLFLDTYIYQACPQYHTSRNVSAYEC